MIWSYTTKKSGKRGVGIVESVRKRQPQYERREGDKKNMNVGNLDESSPTKTFHIFIFWKKTQKGISSKVYGTITLFVIAANVTIAKCTEPKESRPRKRNTFA